MKRSLKHALFTLALLVASLGLTGRAAADKLHLKDGRTLDGTVVREQDGYIWFKVKVGGIEQETFFKPDQVDRLEKEGASVADGKGVTPAPKPAAAPRAQGGAPRAAIISLGESGGKNMVGIYFTADSLRRLIPILEDEKIEVVVFRINSGGGLALELQGLSDVIHNEYKPKFRVAAWIESAISAAAMTSHCIEEIYMMPQGNYGGCTMFRPDGQGGGIAAKGRELEEVLYQMEKISARGKHPKEIMRSMQIMEPLSCTIDENGDVHWYNNLDGQYVVNPPERVLTFTASEAVKYKFAKGIAADINELGKLMGYSEVEWVGKTVPGVPYPVSKAEDQIRHFREQVHQDQARLQEYWTQYQQAFALAAGSPPEDRGKFIAKCREALGRIERMVKNNPNFAFLTFNRLPEDFKYWVQDREEELRKLQQRK